MRYVKIESNLTKIADGMAVARQEALFQTAADIVDVMKQIVPVGTGALCQSIGADPIDSNTVLIGTDKEYAAAVNYGSVNSSAQPYLEPAFTQSEETFKTRLAQAVEKQARK